MVALQGFVQQGVSQNGRPASVVIDVAANLRILGCQTIGRTPYEMEITQH
jgi:hypothetical protein